MPARERGDEHHLDRAILSEDDLRDLLLRPLAQVEEAPYGASLSSATISFLPPIVLSSLRATQLSHRNGRLHCAVQPCRTIDRRRRLVNTAGGEGEKLLLGDADGGGPRSTHRRDRFVEDDVDRRLRRIDDQAVPEHERGHLEDVLGSTTSRPFRRALAFAALTRWIIARELTPRCTPGSSRVRRPSATMRGRSSREPASARAPAEPCRVHDAEERANLAEHVGCDALVREVQHAELALGVRVLEHDLEEEAVELPSGSGDALVLMGVLRGDDEERVGSLCAPPSTVTWRSCIGSKSAAWVRGGVRLISSARSTLVKTAPGRKMYSPRCLLKISRR